MKACIFDIDGTMFLNREYHMLAWRMCLTGQYERPFTDREFADHMFGPTNENIIAWLFGGRVAGEESRALADRKEACYREACRAGGTARLTRGLPQFLDALRVRGCDLAIATGAPIENLRFYWDLFSLGRWFDMSRAVYDDGRLPGKPDPAIYRTAARSIGRDPKECCVFEDAVAGLKSAVGAGIGSVVMIDSTVDAEVLKAMSGVSLVIRDFTDTEKLLRLVEG